MDTSRALAVLKPSLEKNHTLDEQEQYDAVKFLVAQVEKLESENQSARKEAEVYEGAYKEICKVIEEAQQKFGAVTHWKTLPREVEQLFSEVRQFRLDENRLAQAVNWIDQADGTVFEHAIEFIFRAKNVLEERALINQWLNDNRVPLKDSAGNVQSFLSRITQVMSYYALKH